jgi:hypothetical protein
MSCTGTLKAELDKLTIVCMNTTSSNCCLCVCMQRKYADRVLLDGQLLRLQLLN